MTEYEALDLQLQRWELLHQNEEMLLLVITLYLTIMFAYLVAAFFAGAKLSKGQVLIGSGIFTAAAVFTVSQIFIYLSEMDDQGVAIGQHYVDMASEFKKPDYLVLANDISKNAIFDWSDATIISLLVAGIVASLYFMWSVRHPKAE
jgi:hypothetical protein